MLYIFNLKHPTQSCITSTTTRARGPCGRYDGLSTKCYACVLIHHKTRPIGSGFTCQYLLHARCLYCGRTLLYCFIKKHVKKASFLLCRLRNPGAVFAMKLRGHVGMHNSNVWTTTWSANVQCAPLKHIATAMYTILYWVFARKSGRAGCVPAYILRARHAATTAYLNIFSDSEPKSQTRDTCSHSIL